MERGVASRDARHDRVCPAAVDRRPERRSGRPARRLRAVAAPSGAPWAGIIAPWPMPPAAPVAGCVPFARLLSIGGRHRPRPSAAAAIAIVVPPSTSTRRHRQKRTAAWRFCHSPHRGAGGRCPWLAVPPAAMLRRPSGIVLIGGRQVRITGRRRRRQSAALAAVAAGATAAAAADRRPRCPSPSPSLSPSSALARCAAGPVARRRDAPSLASVHPTVHPSIHPCARPRAGPDRRAAAAGRPAAPTTATPLRWCRWLAVVGRPSRPRRRLARGASGARQYGSARQPMQYR